MFCKNCGAEMADTDKVCAGCGAPVEEAPAPAQVKTPPVGGPLESVRANPLYLAAVICMSVVAFFQLIGMLQGAGTGAMFAQLGADSLGAVTVLLSLVALAITGVIVAGLWLCWVSGLDGSKAHLMTLGLKLLWPGILAQLIYMGVVMGLAEIVLLIGAIGVGSYADYGYGYGSVASAATGVMVVTFILVAAVLALMIVYYLKVLKVLKDAQASDATGKLVGVPSMFVVVVTFVLAGCQLLTLLTSGFAGGLNVLNSLAGIGANVLFGIVMLQFRNENASVA